jgi:hypothetical protein
MTRAATKPEITLDNLVIAGEFHAGSFHGDLTVFQNIAIIGNLQSCPGVLLDE